MAEAGFRTPRAVVGLFSGIGGFELGLSRAGIKTTHICENDPAANSVLDKHFPKVERSLDIRDMTSLPTESDMVVAGFPCQNLSSSGVKDGITGSQSSLVGEVFRLLKRNPVEWVLIENVPFMLHLNRGAGIREVVENLESLGYSWAYRVLDSLYFGLPQRRRRVFILASLNYDPRSILLAQDDIVDEDAHRADDTALGFYWTEGRYSTGLSLGHVPPLKGGSGLGIPSSPAISFPDGFVGTPDIRDAERLQGFEANWTEAAEERHKPSVRWKLIGNAVSVNVAEWIGERLQSNDDYCELEDTLFSEEKWPQAAWNIGNGRFVSKASSSPCFIRRRNISEFLEYPLKPLSVRAASGFLKRAKAGNLRLPYEFLHSIERHLNSAEGIQAL